MLRALDEENPLEHASLGQFPQPRFEPPTRFDASDHGWLAGDCIACLLRPHSIRYVARFLFPVGAVLCVAMFLLAGAFLLGGHAPEGMTLPLGLPDLPFHLRLDALSAFFLMILGLSGAGISTFAAGYFRTGEGTAPGLLGLHYHIFLASMAVVMLADDAYLFMVAWETMALSLVLSCHFAAPDSGDPASRFSLSVDGASRRESASCSASESCRGEVGNSLSTPCAMPP